MSFQPNLIQQIPSGLLAALEAKGTGRNPQQLADYVQGGFELEPYFLATRLEITNDSQGNVSFGTTLSTSVPSGEYWRLVGATLRMTDITAAQVPAAFLGIAAPNGNTCVLDSNTFAASTALTDLFWLHWFAPYPMVLPPGWSLNCGLSRALSAGTADLFLRVLFYRLSGG